MDTDSIFTHVKNFSSPAFSFPPTRNTLSHLKSQSKIYFVGIGGISMSGLAEIAKHLGFIVAGSDNHLSKRTKVLEAKDITIFPSQSKINLEQFQPDLIVYTAAILPQNPELLFAKAHHIPHINRAEFLGMITGSFSQVINVTGTHGKTTTTAMIAAMLEKDMDPYVHLGAEFNPFNGTIRLGKDLSLLISEACEYQNSFLEFYSTTAVVTNIDYDHVDCFNNIEEVIHAFVLFSQKMSQPSYLIGPGFDPHFLTATEQIKELRYNHNLEIPILFFTGLKSDQAILQKFNPAYKLACLADNLTYHNGLPKFDVYINQTFYASVHLSIPGIHNVYNALNGIMAAYLNGGKKENIISALDNFQGTEGRFDIKGMYKGATVITDYAHHPAAAKATLEAVKNIPHNQTWVVFQPLTFNRTEILFDDFVESLLPCPHLFFAEIFSDREINSGTISSSMIAEKINLLGGNAEFFQDKNDIIPRLDALVKADDIILILGPEDVRQLADQLISLN